MISMSDKEEKIISRIKEIESTNLARDEIRNEVIETKKEVEKDNELLANKVHQQLTDTPLKSLKIRDNDEAVFSNKYKTAPISNQFINTQLKKYAKKLRIKELNISTHSLRKSFGRRVWEQNNCSDRSLIILSEIFFFVNRKVRDVEDWLFFKRVYCAQKATLGNRCFRA